MNPLSFPGLSQHNMSIYEAYRPRDLKFKTRTQPLTPVFWYIEVFDTAWHLGLLCTDSLKKFLKSNNPIFQYHELEAFVMSLQSKFCDHRHFCHCQLIVLMGGEREKTGCEPQEV